MRNPLVLALIVGCGGGPDGPATRLSLTCAFSPDNALRLDCAAEIPPGRTLDLQWTDGPRAHALRTTASSFTLTGLRPDTTYTWEAQAGRFRQRGSWTTGSLPEGLPTLNPSGQASVPYVLLAVGTFVAIASTEDGAITWYEDSQPDGNEPMRGLVSGFDWTGDGVAWHITSIVRWVGLDGTERLRLSRGEDFDRPLHHDLFWAGDHLWAMNAGVHGTPEGDFVYDGLYAFGTDGALWAEWDLYDHWPTQPTWTGSPQVMWDGLFPGAEDVAHGNAVFEAEDGTVLISLRFPSEIWALEGLDSGAFGTPRFVLRGVGEPADLVVQADPALTELADFRGQHHPRLEDGRLTLFDNRSGPNARSLTLALDEEQGTATIVEAHDLDRTCGIQGAVYPLANGNRLVTCATSIEVFEFAGGSAPDAPPVWTLTVDTDQPWVARAIPIADPPEGWAP